MVSGPVLAEIYKYRDKFGNIHFTDKPMKRSHGYKLMWRSSRESGYSGISRIDTGSMKVNRQRFSKMISVTAKNTGIHPELLHAVIRAESAYDPKALSKAGAQGLMQLMPATARRYGVNNSWDPIANLDGGARYLSDLLEMFDDNIVLALAAYNAGENAVIKYGYTIPPYPETQNYVRKVIDFYQEGRKLARNMTASR